MPPGHFRYHSAGLGQLLLIPWLSLVAAAVLAYLLFANPNFLVPSTRPAGYFGLLLAGATAVYFFRYDWYRRQQFETTDAGLAVVTRSGKRTMTPWADFSRADYHTNTGALVLVRSQGAGSVVVYPAALVNGSSLVTEIDARTELQLAGIPDLQAALQRAV